MPPVHTLSFRTSLLGEVSEFLEKLGMECTSTAKALVEMIVALSHYQEEGVTLYPEVVVCDDLDLALRLLRGIEPIEIGTGHKSPETMQRALKTCAPLARNGWAVYLERQHDGFAFGVFRESVAPTAPDLRNTMLDLSLNETKAILAMQIAPKSVELIGTGNVRLQIHLSSARDDSGSPFDAVQRLADAIVADVTDEWKEQTCSYIRTALFNALRDGHGALVAVIPVSTIPHQALIEDSVLLKPPIELLRSVQEHEKESSSSAFSSLLAYSRLLSGMMGSDGITLISAGASIIGYNAFIKSPEVSTIIATPRQLVGGARRRAYKVLCGLVDAGALTAAFFRSSDGFADCYRRSK